MYMGAKLRIDNAKDMQSLRAATAIKKLDSGGDINYPSWLYDDNYVTKFLAALASAAYDADVPQEVILGVLKDHDYRNKLLNIAGVMEESGYSFEEQSLAATETLMKDWSKTRYS